MAESAARRLNRSGRADIKDEVRIATFAVDLFAYWLAFHRGEDCFEPNLNVAAALKDAAKKSGVVKIAKEVLRDLRKPVGSKEPMVYMLEVYMLPMESSTYIDEKKYNSQVDQFLEWLKMPPPANRVPPKPEK